MKRPIPNVLWRRGVAYVRVQIDGRRITRSLRTRSKTEARNRAGQFIAQLQSGTPPAPRRPRLDLDDLIERFTAHRAPELRPLSRADYLTRLERFRQWCANAGVILVHQLTPDVLMTYRAERLADVAPATVRSDLSPVRAMMNYAYRLDWIADNPFHRLPPPPRFARTERRLVTPAELETFLDKSPVAFRLIHSVAAFHGLRRSELVNLRFDDIDRRRRLVHVVNRPPDFIAKTYESRTLPLARRVADLLPRTARGRIAPTSSVHTLTANACAAMHDAGLAGGLHLLRHSWVTYLLLAGCPVADVMRYAGHARVSTTEGYAHLHQSFDPNDVARFRDALGYPA